MKIRESEKLILIMLADVYEKLGLDGVDPDFIREAIYSGNTWGLYWKYPGIFPEQEEENPPVVGEVVDYLEMWSFIEDSFQVLDGPTQAGIKDQKDLMSPVFHGFDGNNETEHMGVAIFMVKHLERFTEFEGRDMNSHCPMLPRYRRMLEVFRPIRETLAGVRQISVNGVTAPNGI